MALVSRLFRGVDALEACALRDGAHITLGTVGAHVPRIQKALMLVERVLVDADEVDAMRYGPSTAAAVLAYKKKRNIINRSYQTQADNIVGRMTIVSLDKEVLGAEGPLGRCPCGDPIQGSTGAAIVRGSASQLIDTPVNLNVRLKVAYQTAASADKTFAGALRANAMRFAFETQANVLLAPWGMSIQPTNLGTFAFPFSVDPSAPTDVQKLREFAEKAANTDPSILRIIFCKFDKGRREFGVSGGPAFGGIGFKPFVLLNMLNVREDAGTMTHEMIHTSRDDLFTDSAHDSEVTFPSSVFCSQNGRTEIRKPHAIALSKAFFAA